MKYNELNTTKNRSPNRVGRGIAAGQGKTAGRGTKGQQARTGSRRKPGFEGGSNPLMQRLPKLPGFKSHRPVVEVVYTGQLDSLGAVITNAKLAEAGLVSSAYVKVKLLVLGEVTKKTKVSLQSASKSAISLIEKAGGTFQTTPQVGRPAKKADK